MKKLLLVAALATLSALVGCTDASLPYINAIAVTPGAPSVAAGRTQQFVATATFTNGTTKDISSLVTWSSSTAPVGTISSAGLAQTYSQGTSTITASYTILAGTVVTGTTTLTVTAPALLSVVVTDPSAVTPTPQPLKSAVTAKGTSHQFLAYGVYSDGGIRNITSTVTWASSAAAVATVSAGRAVGVAAGTATITATDPTTSLAGSTPLAVSTATINNIIVYPVNASIASQLGQTINPLTRLPYAARGQFSDGTTQDVTADAAWASTNPAAATVSSTTPNGVVTGVAAGLTAIQASLGGSTGSVALLVSSASLTAITLTPSTSGVAIGSTLLLSAVGTFSDGSKQVVNLGAAWSVIPSNGSFATVDQTGLVTGVATGAAMVTAKIGTVSTSATLNVEAIKSLVVTPAGVVVNPSTATIAVGTPTQFIATATLADGTSTQNISSSVTWIAINGPAVSGTLPVGTVSDSPGTAGWALGNTAGTSTIGAVFSGQYSLDPLTVTSATLKTLAITPTGNTHLGLGLTQQYTATGTFSDSSTQNLSNQVTWISSSPGVAVINFNGLATSTGVGTTNVTAVGIINGTTATASPVVLSTP